MVLIRFGFRYSWFCLFRDSFGFMKKFGLAVQREIVRYNRVGMTVRNGGRKVTQRAQGNGHRGHRRRFGF